MRMNAPQTDATPSPDAIGWEWSPARVGDVRLPTGWVVALTVLGVALLAVAITLVAVVRRFEHEEALRQQRADAAWLQRALGFHLQRLERDLAHLATLRPDHAVDPSNFGGALLRDPKAVTAWGWWTPMAVGRAIAALDADRLTHPDNAAALDALRAAAQAFGRSSYVGPMRDDLGQPLSHGWLAVPASASATDRLVVARIDWSAVLAAVVPAWYAARYRVTITQTGAPDAASGGEEDGIRTVLDLPDAPLVLSLHPRDVPTPGVPRGLLALALVLLLALGAAAWAMLRGARARHQAQHNLQAEVAFRRAMERAVRTGLQVRDMQGRICYVNRAFCELVGFAPQELLGRAPPLPYWPDESCEALRTLHETPQRSGTPTTGVELVFRHRDGRRLDVLVHESALLDANGRQIGWMSAALDITERKRVQRLEALHRERLQALGQLVAVGEMASTLAHELNQPLGALNGFAHGLLNRLRTHPPSLDDITNVVEHIAALADKAGRIVQRVHGFARRRELDARPLVLQPFLRGLIESLQARAHGVRIEAEWPPEQVVVLADPGWLEHAVRNVLDNAIHWAATRSTPARPARVHVSLHREAHRIGIAIGDSGPGVAADIAETLFTAFVSRKEGGMGMGLAIARSVVEAHRGRIDVGRDPQLGGARFTLWLPHAPAPENTP